MKRIVFNTNELELSLFGWHGRCLKKTSGPNSLSRLRAALEVYMENIEIEKTKLLLKSLTDQNLDELLTNVLQEMRQRDFEHLKGDLLTNSKRLPRLSIHATDSTCTG